jgi:putative ABC transport system ATP-binding protein
MKIVVDYVSKTKQLRIEGTNDREPLNVLHDVSFSVETGEIFTVIGPSGSGKSTLLRLINRLEEPDSGRILYDGTAISAIDILTLRTKISLVGQIPVMLDGTVEDNLRYPLSLRKRPLPTSFRSGATTLLDHVGLGESFMPRHSHQLSEGEKQRVCIARALMNQPDVLLLDEPTATLDPTTANRLLYTVKALNKGLRLTIIMVTHQMEHAKLVGHHTALLLKGTIVEQNRTDDFFARPQSEATRAFINGEV